MSRTVTRLRQTQTGVDRYDNPVFDWVPTEIAGAMFAPKGMDEVAIVGRTMIPSEPTLYWFKARPDITEFDRVVVDGLEYEVDGVPSPWQDDLGGTEVGGLVVTLKRVTG